MLAPAALSLTYKQCLEGSVYVNKREKTQQVDICVVGPEICVRILTVKEYKRNCI